MDEIDTKKEWQLLVQSHEQFNVRLQDFLKHSDKLSLLKSKLISQERGTAIAILQYLDTNDLKQVFGELIFLASFVHGQLESIRRLILSLPKQWIINNIEKSAELVLEKGTYEEYRRLLELYVEIDNELANRLINKTQMSHDTEIREVGQEFKERLEKKFVQQ